MHPSFAFSLATSFAGIQFNLEIHNTQDSIRFALPSLAHIPRGAALSDMTARAQHPRLYTLGVERPRWGSLELQKLPVQQRGHLSSLPSKLVCVLFAYCVCVREGQLAVVTVGREEATTTRGHPCTEHQGSWAVRTCPSSRVYNVQDRYRIV